MHKETCKIKYTKGAQGRTSLLKNIDAYLVKPGLLFLKTEHWIFTMASDKWEQVKISQGQYQGLILTLILNHLNNFTLSKFCPSIQLAFILIIILFTQLLVTSSLYYCLLFSFQKIRYPLTVSSLPFQFLNFVVFLIVRCIHYLFK